ncbi:MAG: triphosphoribosyl-dephospho-CoA synthase CitG [Spirochaetales bacterium]|jgi:holo-ACP synthase/triphosphoribosyl-dephospho-CoA synthase|nr:triphosphoribosyl-dephospho-CoA synthase CitG [Spirochaetales bacterium]
MNVFEGCVPVRLEDVLAEREARASSQQRLLNTYTCTLVCLTLNIAGEYKAFPLARRCFQEGIRAMKRALDAEGLMIVHQESTLRTAGYAAYFSVAACPENIKTLACDIEAAHPLGRLFDFDVLRPDGRKLSRRDAGGTPRRCFVCGGDAFVCARSSAHEAAQVSGAMIAIMNTWLRETLSAKITQAAVKALMAEVATTPKPGLVDRANNGSHADMDFFSFIDSAAALLPYFQDCALRGFEHDSDAISLFYSLRPGGRRADIDMRSATGGVNVHKGIIFSAGLISAAYGHLYRGHADPSPAEIAAFCKEMTSRLMEDFSGLTAENAKTPGEQLYARYGITGIRGEAASGFAHVCAHSLPMLCRMLKAGHSMNDAGVAALLSLLAVTDDTTIIHRSDIATLRRIQKQTADFLSSDPSMETIIHMAQETDASFIEKNISAGGCADLLAITWFFYYLNQRHPVNDPVFHRRLRS